MESYEVALGMGTPTRMVLYLCPGASISAIALYEQDGVW